MSEKKVISSIHIQADPERVWQALVHPDFTRQYMFGCETVSDWKPGSELLWRGMYEGNPVVFVKGRILEIDPVKLLRYTVIDPNAAYPDIPENHLRVTYELLPDSTGTLLKVTQDGFETVAEGEQRYKDVYNNGAGWDPILKAIKGLLEPA